MYTTMPLNTNKIEGHHRLEDISIDSSFTITNGTHECHVIITNEECEKEDFIGIAAVRRKIAIAELDKQVA